MIRIILLTTLGLIVPILLYYHTFWSLTASGVFVADQKTMNVSEVDKSRQIYLKYRTVKEKHSHKEELKQIREIIEKRLRYLQNPTNCRTRRKFACNVHECGFGCEVNTVAMCLMLGYALNRTVVVQPPLMQLLEPVGDKCVDNMVGSRAKFGKDHDRFDIVDYDVRVHHDLDFFPPAVPDDLADRMKGYHDNPYLWWTGIVSQFVFRPNSETLEFLVKHEVQLELPKPIVGIHIRRTDKVQREAHVHKVEDYMKHVNKWYSQLDKQIPNVDRRIFLATDEPAVIQEVVSKYPNYTIINNRNFTKIAQIKENRHTDTGRLGFIHDVYMLSRCDFLVCTFTSNICRLAVQLMHARRGNITNYAVSLDIHWFFWGENLLVKKAPNDIARAKMPIYDTD